MTELLLVLASIALSVLYFLVLHFALHAEHWKWHYDLTVKENRNTVNYLRKDLNARFNSLQVASEQSEKAYQYSLEVMTLLSKSNLKIRDGRIVTDNDYDEEAKAGRIWHGMTEEQKEVARSNWRYK